MLRKLYYAVNIPNTAIFVTVCLRHKRNPLMPHKGRFVLSRCIGCLVLKRNYLNLLECMPALQVMRENLNVVNVPQF